MKQVEVCGTKVSKMGFGTLRLPINKETNLPDYEETERMVDAFMCGGGNYFDLGYSYGKEHAEKYIGAALKKYNRNDYYLADKIPTWRCKQAEDVDKIFQIQLERVGVDYFDFYLIHSIKEKRYDEIEKYKVVEQLLGKKQSGQIKHLGASCHCGPELLRKLLDTYTDALEFVQLQINYMDWNYSNAKELYNIAVKYKKPIMVMEPLRGGHVSRSCQQNGKRDIGQYN